MRYLISGYYGEKNAGDEAILAGILQEVSRRDPEARYVVLSFDPDDTRRRHGGGRELEAVSTGLRPPGRLLQVMSTADLLISGGGSFLHEADFELHGRSFLFREGKLRPVPYFISIVLMARAQRLPVMWYAQGLGPLHTRSARRWVAGAASLSQAVTWRDPESARLAYEIGVRAPVHLVVPDPAYALAPAPRDQAQAELARSGLDLGTRYLAVCPRPWLGRTGYLEALGEALEKAGDALDLDILLIPFHEVQDPPVCETLAARPGLAGRAHVLPPVVSPAVLAAVLGGAELVVAMRLHSGILAATAGTPAVVVDYDPKTRAFAAQTGQSAWAVDVNTLEGPVDTAAASAAEAAASAPPASGVAALVEAIVATAKDLPARRAALARAVAPLRAEAGRTAALAVQLAAGGSLTARAGGPGGF
ncbi:MAG: polysaccharide pyruvyl transferase family protein [Actinomycetia bacterium]|nr:polysaccharide pyruvyl transferase family protein [Actinomycetes bacterium]